MEITKVRHAWPEKKGFLLNRRNCNGQYVFIHFWQPVKLTINSQIFETGPNAVVIIDKNSANVIDSSKSDLIHDFIHITGEDVVGLMDKYGLKTNTVYYPTPCGFITDIIRKIEGETFENDTHKNEVVLSYFHILIALISRYKSRISEGYIIDYQTETQFKNLRTMIFSNLERDWSISHMAEIVNLSESRFYVLYKAVFKTTPNQDLILARMDYAKRLLTQNRNVSILEVAQKCGYANEFHFIRIFKKNVGVTPKKYALIQWSTVFSKK